MKKTRLFRLASGLAACILLAGLGAGLGGTLVGCKAQRPATPTVEPPGLPIVLHAMTIRTQTYSPEDVPEQYRAAEPRDGQAYYLVHMTDLIRSSWVERLQGMELRIAGYLSYNTLILGMTPAVRDEVKKLSFVQWTGLYQPYFKLAPDIQALGISGNQPQVDISVFNPATLSQVSQQIANLGLQVVTASTDTWRGKLRVVLDPVLLPKLAALTEVEWIEPASVAVSGGTAQEQATGISAGATFPPSLYDLLAGFYALGSRVSDLGLVPQAPGTSQSYGTLAAEVDRFAWDHKDGLLVLRSGNGGVDADGDGTGDAGTMLEAGAAKDALVVGSSEAPAGSSGAGSTAASFSGRGPAADGRIKPDLVAPANSTFDIAGSAGDAYQFLVKTSGLAAPSAALLKALLVCGAANNAAGTPDSGAGWGGLNLRASVNSSSLLKLQDNAEGMGTGETRTYKVDISGAGELRVTLAWTDYPSLPEAGLNLVNDLDLRVIGPGNVYYYPNGRNSRDPLNNLERVVVPLAGQPGEYTIEITASNVPFGPQPFALVAAQL